MNADKLLKLREMGIEWLHRKVSKKQFLIIASILVGREVQDTITIAYIEFIEQPSPSEQRKLHDWLTIRVHTDSLLLVPRSK